MGSEISCECLTEAFNSATGGLGTLASQQILASKLDLLKKETKFYKKVLLGMTSQEIILRLSEDESTIIWRCPATSVSSTWAAVSGANAEQFGEVSLVENVATVRSVLPDGFAVVDFSKQILLEVVAPTKDADGLHLRDTWVEALNDLLAGWISKPSSKPRAALSAAGTSNKAAYFAMREKEIQERKAIADEKRKKYTAGGMKYTAIAMMNRDAK